MAGLAVVEFAVACKPADCADDDCPICVALGLLQQVSNARPDRRPAGQPAERIFDWAPLQTTAPTVSCLTLAIQSPLDSVVWIE